MVGVLEIEKIEMYSHHRHGDEKTTLIGKSVHKDTLDGVISEIDWPDKSPYVRFYYKMLISLMWQCHKVNGFGLFSALVFSLKFYVRDQYHTIAMWLPFIHYLL